VPRFFRGHELVDFEEFIDSSGCPYFVVLSNEDVVGCGGYGLRPGSDAADLCWGMVFGEHHGKGIGGFLLLARLHAIATTTEARRIRLATSQLTEGFFRRYGFRMQSRKPDGIALGLDDIEMRIELTDVNRAAIEHRWRKIVG
jgi:hypothetical protein